MSLYHCFNLKSMEIEVHGRKCNECHLTITLSLVNLWSSHHILCPKSTQAHITVHFTSPIEQVQVAEDFHWVCLPKSISMVQSASWWSARWVHYNIQQTLDTDRRCFTEQVHADCSKLQEVNEYCIRIALKQGSWQLT